jgi:hypothetical protein
LSYVLKSLTEQRDTPEYVRVLANDREGSEIQRSASKKFTISGNFALPRHGFKVNLDHLFIHSSIRVGARMPTPLIHL